MTEVEYDYLVVECKNPQCRKQIFLYCFGAHHKFIGHTVYGSETIEVHCQACDQTHSYEHTDFRGVTGPEPPPDFVPHPKIQPKTSY